MLDSGFRIKYNEADDFCLHVLAYIQKKETYIEAVQQLKEERGLTDEFADVLNRASAEEKAALTDCMTQLFGDNNRADGWLETAWRDVVRTRSMEQTEGSSLEVRRWSEILLQEQGVYHTIWERHYEKMQVLEEDFNDFMNWRIHQIEFFYGYTKQVPRAAALLSVRLGIQPETELEERRKPLQQYMPMITEKEEYNRAYFCFLLQQTLPVCRTLLEEFGHTEDGCEAEGLVKRMTLAAAYILVESCHSVLKAEFETVYGLQNVNLSNAGRHFEIPEELYDRLCNYLLGME